MTTSSGDPLLARCLRAEAALATQREITRIIGDAWRDLSEALAPGTPRVQLAIQIQERMQREIVALQAKEGDEDEILW